MNIYKSFATVYSKGAYPQYSLQLAAVLPRILEKFQARPTSLLDVACGEGSFAIAVAKRYRAVTGLDQSADMLRIARTKARSQGARVTFVKGDMRSIPFEEKFDLVTCLYDSLNYLLKQKDLRRTFEGVARALHPGGVFIFDMNMEHALSVIWQEQPTEVHQDTREIFEVHRPSYNIKKRIATLRITAFVKNKGGWTKTDEKHQERAYSLTQIRQCLESAGLTELACWGSIRKMTPPRKDSGAVWFMCSKGR